MKNNKLLIISIVVSLCIAGIVIGSTFYNKNPKTESYDIVVFGDSNVGTFRYDVCAVGQLKERTGLSTLNAGIGGTTLTGVKNSEADGNPWKYYSMVELSKAMIKDDFSVQKAEHPDYYVDFHDGEMDFLKDLLETLSNTDFNQTAFVFICHGLNDYLSGMRIQNPEDPYDIYTFEGALRTSIDNLKVAAPNARIILIGAPYNTVSGDSDTVSTGHGTLPDYLEVEKKIAAEYGITYAPMSGPINADNILDYSYDGMHYNLEGSSLLADVMYDAMQR